MIEFVGSGVYTGKRVKVNPASIVTVEELHSTSCRLRLIDGSTIAVTGTYDVLTEGIEVALGDT